MLIRPANAVLFQEIRVPSSQAGSCGSMGDYGDFHKFRTGVSGRSVASRDGTILHTATLIDHGPY